MKSLKKYVQKTGKILELAIAVLTLAGIILSIFGLLKDFETFLHLQNDTFALKEYLEKILNIVIGIEFVEMLCRPSSDNVMEVLIFLVARHMIVGDTTPFDDFVSVISIALLCILRKYLHSGAKMEKDTENSLEDEL